jgi:hypothetical protein
MPFLLAMIPITEYPSFMREMKGYLEPAFGNHRAVDNAMRFLTGLIVSSERKNVSSVNRSFTDYRNQASMNNFITDSTRSDEEFHRAAIHKDGLTSDGCDSGDAPPVHLQAMKQCLGPERIQSLADGVMESDGCSPQNDDEIRICKCPLNDDADL